jgi:hypothetical protein
MGYQGETKFWITLSSSRYYNSCFFQLDFLVKKKPKSDKGKKEHHVNLDKSIWIYPMQLSDLFY